MAIIRMRDHLYDEIVNYAKEHLPEEPAGFWPEWKPGREGKSERYIFWRIKIMQKITSPWIQRSDKCDQGYACQWIETAGKLAFPSVFSIPSVSGGYPSCF